MAVQYENSEKGSNENVLVNIPATGRRGSQRFHTCSPQYIFLIITLIVTVIVSVVTLVVFLTRYQPTSSGTNLTNLAEKIQISTTQKPIKTSNHLLNEPNEATSVDPTINVTLRPHFTIVSRREWLAKSPVQPVQSLSPPVPYVFITDTEIEQCADRGTCAFHVHFLQNLHIDSRGWDDIRYNFLVGGDGFAYEGRGWNKQGALIDDYNSKSIEIGLIGSFDDTVPPEKQIIAAKTLIQVGIEKGYISPNFKLLARRQVANTYKNPGLALYQDLQKWPHWTANP